MLELLPKDESVNEEISSGASMMYNFLKETSGDKPADLSEKWGSIGPGYIEVWHQPMVPRLLMRWFGARNGRMSLYCKPWLRYIAKIV